LYPASRSCLEVLNELILEVLLSTLKPCINTKLQNRHAQVNLLYHGGVTPDFPKKTKCKPICMPGSSFMHIVTYK
jgi:hypothetical protein